MWLLFYAKLAIHDLPPLSWAHYKLFTFLSVDMEIITPWSSQVHHEAQPNGAQDTEGCYNLHIYG